MRKIEPLLNRLETYLTPDNGNYAEIWPNLINLTQLYERDPWRSYHNVKHLEEMVNFLIASEKELKNPTAIFAAVLGHDSVYEPWLYGGGINEDLSAKRTEYFLMPHYGQDLAGVVSAYIRATAAHPVDVVDTDLAYFLDADMSILAADSERFEEYEHGIYKEFTWLGTIARKEYLEGRLNFFKSIESERIFITEIAQDMYEERAHRNIGRMALKHEIELRQI